MENETEYAPWLAAISGFNWLRNRLASTPEQLTELNVSIMTPYLFLLLVYSSGNLCQLQIIRLKTLVLYHHH